MRSLIRRRPETVKADPAPSRWSWRMQRLMLTPGFRFALRVGLPFTLSLLAGTIYMADEERRGTVVQAIGVTLILTGDESFAPVAAGGSALLILGMAMFAFLVYRHTRS